MPWATEKVWLGSGCCGRRTKRSPVKRVSVVVVVITIITFNLCVGTHVM